MLRSTVCLSCVLGLLLVGVATPAMAQPELSYEQYRALSWVADRMDHMTMFEPLEGDAGMYLAIAERFGTVQVFKHDANGVERTWKSRHLGGVPRELLVADLDGDGFDDALLCRTSAGQVYVWKLDDLSLIWESLPGEYREITAYTTHNLDEGPELEIVLLADGHIFYVDGVTFNKEFKSIDAYEATMVRCGDVDGDSRPEIVLNSGKVVSVAGDLEWEEQNFYDRIELLDIDGDGIPEVLTEPGNGGPLKAFDIDYRSEVRFQ